MRKILSLLMLLLLTTAGSWAQEVHLVKRGNSTLLTADLAAKTAAGDLYVALQQHVVDKVGNKNVTYERYISGTGAMTANFDYTNGTTTWKVIAQDGGGYVLQNSTGSYLKNNGSNPATTTADQSEATVYMVSDWGGNSTSMLVSGYNQKQALKWEVKNQNNLKINTNSTTIIHNTGTGGYTKIFTYEVEKKTITPISFNPNITYQEGLSNEYRGRYLNSIALQSSGRTQTISAGYTNPISSKQYLNLTNQHFTVGAGATVKPIIDWKGAWMHGMVYIDLNGDGDFSDEGENVANSALGNNDNPNLATGIATFTAPAEPGDYLMRFKVDWQDLGSAGSSNICNSGGSITDVMLRVRNTANITLNIAGDVTRNVPMNDLPEDTYDVATLLGAAMPSYITFTPSSITTSTTDQTIDVTANQSLPFATDGTQYFMKMKSKYVTTESTNSTQSTLQIQNSYLWTFSGNAIDGIKLRNVGADKYAKVDDSDNSVATFVSEGDASWFELSASSYNDGTGVGGFCLKLAGTTNCYLNDRDNKLSTWKDSRGINDHGSMFKFESLSPVILAKLNELTSMTNYVGGVQAEALEAGHAFKTKLDEVTADPTVDGYNEVITLAESNKVALADGGYYRIVSAYSGFQQGQEKAVYNDGGTMKWKAYAAEDASMVLKFIKNGDKWRIYVPSADAYMAGNTGTTKTDADSAANYTFTDFGNAELNINDGTGNLHAGGHNNGAGANGTLFNHGSGAGGASSWYVIRYGSEVSEDQLIAPYQTSVDTVYQTYATSEKVIVVNPGVKVYKVTGVAGEKATIEDAGTSVVPASRGVILSGERSKTFTMLRVTTDVASQYADNVLVQGDGTAQTGHFVLAYREADTDAHFYKIGTLEIPANRAYLPASYVSSTVAALSLNFGDDDELTAIESLPVQAESAQGQAFDLQGRRVSKLQKGIYIVGGKKVMVK